VRWRAEACGSAAVDRWIAQWVPHGISTWMQSDPPVPPGRPPEVPDPEDPPPIEEPPAPLPIPHDPPPPPLRA